MKTYPAIAIVEFKDIAVGMHATDAMAKKAPISILKCGIISHGRYLTLIGGTTASVEESLKEGLERGGPNVIDHVFLPDVHPQVHDCVLGQRNVTGRGAMAIIETPTAASNVRAAEMALKGTPVELIEIRLAESSLSGKGVSVYCGELPDIQAAVDIAMAYLKEAGVEAVQRIIPRPHEALFKHLETGTYFTECALMDLGGEAD